MQALMSFARSSLGAKVVMALSGILLLLFVIVHMIGNLQIFSGPEAINSYAAFLHARPGMLWTARICLLVTVLLHIVSGLRLAALNRAARPDKYVVRATLKASLTSRTMALSGLVILAFIIFHLLEFTFGMVQPQYFHQLDAQQRYDVYSMVVHGFQVPAISISYIVAMIFLGLHLSHGASSILQTLGLNHHRYAPLFEKAGKAVALVIVIGNCSMPICVMMGCIKLHGGH